MGRLSSSTAATTYVRPEHVTVESSYIERQRRKWSALAPSWNDSGPPAAPSHEDLALFVSLLERAGARRVLVLGCTPGLRNAVAVVSTVEEITVVDVTPAMFEHTLELIHRPELEQHVLAPWTDTGLPANSFDAIVGDKALDNVPPHDWPRLFGEFSRIGSPSGVLLQHVGMQATTSAAFTVPACLEAWCTRLNEGLPLAEAAAGFWEDLLTESSRRSRDETLSIAHWISELNEPGLDVTCQGAAELLKRFWEDFGSSIGETWTDVSWALLERHAAPTYALTDCVYPSDYEAAVNQPIIELARVDSLSAPRSIELLEMADLEGRRIWDEIWLVSSDLALDTGDEFGQLVMRNVGMGVSYRYLAPEGIAVLPELRRMSESEPGRISVSTLTPAEWDALPLSSHGCLFYMRTSTPLLRPPIALIEDLNVDRSSKLFEVRAAEAEGLRTAIAAQMGWTKVKVTRAEAEALGRSFNIADGHPRQTPSEAEASAVYDRLGELMAEARVVSQRDADERAFTAFHGLAGQATAPFDMSLVCYSSSLATEMVANYLARRSQLVALVQPTFDNIADILRRNGVHLEPVDLDVDGPLDLDAVVVGELLARLSPSVGTIFWVTPNNPTGHRLTPEGLSVLAQWASSGERHVVLDTSFRLFDAASCFDFYALLGGSRWICIEDTGKIWPTCDVKIAFLNSCPEAAAELLDIYDDLQLSASPFVALVVEACSTAGTRDGLASVRQLIGKNRELAIQTLASVGTGLCVDSAVSVQLIRLNEDSDAAVERWRTRHDVAALSASGFYWHNPANPVGTSTVRVALSRDSEYLRHALDRIVEGENRVAR